MKRLRNCYFFNYTKRTVKQIKNWLLTLSQPEGGTLSVTVITLRYDFALSHNAFLPSRTVIASNCYRSVHIGPVIASYSYRGRYRLALLHLFVNAFGENSF